MGHSQDLADLVKASKEAIAQARAEKRAQRQRELEQAQKLAEEQRLRAEEQAASTARIRKRAMAIGAVGIVALVLAVLATLFWLQATPTPIAVTTRQRRTRPAP